jgi:hypothetical protein
MTTAVLKFTFETDKFRLSGPLPEDANAGNQFYGEDMAQWICESLPAWQLDYSDEDWGWWVSSIRESAPADEQNTVCVYAYPSDSQPANSGSWMLMVESERKVPWLKFFSRWKQTDFNTRFGVDLLNALRALGVHNLRATVVHTDSSGNESSEVEFSG